MSAKLRKLVDHHSSLASSTTFAAFNSEASQKKHQRPKCFSPFSQRRHSCSRQPRTRRRTTTFTSPPRNARHSPKPSSSEPSRPPSTRRSTPSDNPTRSRAPESGDGSTSSAMPMTRTPKSQHRRLRSKPPPPSEATHYHTPPDRVPRVTERVDHVKDASAKVQMHLDRLEDDITPLRVLAVPSRPPAFCLRGLRVVMRLLIVKQPCATCRNELALGDM